MRTLNDVNDLSTSRGFQIFGKVQKDSNVQVRHFSYYFVLFALLMKWRPPRCQKKYFFLRLGGLLGTLRSKDGDGRENVAEKVNSRSFNLHRDYSKSLTLSNVGEPS